MDAVFGGANFRNDLIWHYKNASRGKKEFAHSHDSLLWYSRSASGWTFERDAVLRAYESGMTAWRYEKKGMPPPAGKTPDDVIEIPL